MEQRKPYDELCKRQNANRLKSVTRQANRDFDRAVSNFSSSSFSNNNNENHQHSQLRATERNAQINNRVCSNNTVAHGQGDIEILNEAQGGLHDHTGGAGIQPEVHHPNEGQLDDVQDRLPDNFDNFFDVDYEVVAVLPALPLRSDLAQWACYHRINQTAIRDLLRRSHRHANNDDALASLPLDPRTLMKTPKSVEIVPLGVGEFTYYGLEKAIIDQLKIIGFLDFLVIYFDLFADGIPIFSSRSLSLIALLGKIVHPLYNKHSLIAAYYGKEKAPDVHEFMAPFVAEYDRLRTVGFCFNGVHILVKIRCVTADTPARN
ncbi:hypothetical protein QAD02_000837 [Eretmocerus hayati]|uniref:Uncharacterized protein n=1 Tax=Eretmocerus hayati TaxID=131215 RepID=A0ACC2NEJ2_9HYME|nr:hypothetical protein QAD02_000837 [Eretmocerus hayati]